MNELALFAGAGGGILGGYLLGWRTICAVEINSYARSVLLKRQKDKILNKFPIWDDIKTFNGFPWRGYVDVVSGGFPCQDISPQGKRAGIAGNKSGLWIEMARIISEVQPRYVLVENSSQIINNGLDEVLADFATMGYNVKWGIISASQVGAQHERKRCWIFAFTNANTNSIRSFKKTKRLQLLSRSKMVVDEECWRMDKSIIHGENYGLAHRVDRLKAIGNGQVPAVVKLAWELLS